MGRKQNPDIPPHPLSGYPPSGTACLTSQSLVLAHALACEMTLDYLFLAIETIFV